MLQDIPHNNLLVIATAIAVIVLVSAAWLYLVMRRTRAARITLRAFGVAVDIDMTRERRKLFRRKSKVEPESEIM